MNIAPPVLANSSSIPTVFVYNRLFDIVRIRPNGPGTGPIGQTAQHIKSSGAFSSNWQFMSNDDDATYVKTESDGLGGTFFKRDAYSFDDLVLGNRRVNTATVFVKANIVQSNGISSIDIICWEAGEIVLNKTLLSPGSGVYSYVQATIENDPVTGDKFTKSTINSRSFGFSTTVSDDEFVGVPTIMRITDMYIDVNIDRAIQITVGPMINSNSNIETPNVVVNKQLKLKVQTIENESLVGDGIRLHQYQQKTYPQLRIAYWGRMGESAVFATRFSLQTKVIQQLAQGPIAVAFSESPGVCEEDGTDLLSPNKSIQLLRTENANIDIGVSVNGKVMFGKAEQSWGTSTKTGGVWNSVTYSGLKLSTAYPVYLKLYSGSSGISNITGLLRLAVFWTDYQNVARSDTIIILNGSNSIANNNHFLVPLTYYPYTAKSIDSFSISLDTTNMVNGATAKLVTLLNSPHNAPTTVLSEQAPAFYRVSQKCLDIFSLNDWWLKKDGWPSRLASGIDPNISYGPVIAKTGTPSLVVFNGPPNTGAVRPGQIYFDITNQAAVNFFIDMIKRYIYDNAFNNQGVKLAEVFFDEITGGSNSLNIENIDDNIWLYNFGSLENLLEGPVNGRVRLSKANGNAAWQQACNYLYKRFKKIMPSTKLYVNGPASLTADIEGRMSQTVTQFAGSGSVAPGSAYSTYTTMISDFAKTPRSLRTNMIHGNNYPYPPQYYNTTGSPAANFTDGEMYNLRLFPNGGTSALYITGAQQLGFEKLRRFCAVFGAILDSDFMIDDNAPFHWPWHKSDYTPGSWGVPIEYQNGTSDVPVIEEVAGTNGNILKRVFTKAILYCHIGKDTNTYSVAGSNLSGYDVLVVSGQVIAPPTLTGGYLIPSITVRIQQSARQILVSGPITGSGSFQNPLLRVGRRILASSVIGGYTINPVRVKMGIKIIPLTLNADSTINNPRLNHNQRIYAIDVSGVSTVNNPKLLIGKYIYPPTLTGLSTIHNPSFVTFVDSLIVISNISYMVTLIKGYETMSTSKVVYTGTEPLIQDYIYDQDGSPINLAQASSLVLNINKPNSSASPATVSIPASFLDDLNDNKARAQISNNNSSKLDVAGTYEYQFVAVIDGHPYKSNLRKFRVKQAI